MAFFEKATVCLETGKMVGSWSNHPLRFRSFGRGEGPTQLEVPVPKGKYHEYILYKLNLCFAQM